MSPDDFHDKPFDEGTLTKLRIFELYAQEWIPVFVSQDEPPFRQIHIFDFFCGPGTDSKAIHGSPLRIMNQLLAYQHQQMAGWSKVEIIVHFFDDDPKKIERLQKALAAAEWRVQGVRVDCRALAFADALSEHRKILADRGAAKSVT